ncbi:MAG: SCO family protein [Acidobacteria bacterium]|nr:SCO family protein [Acidobacteriota bacterium]
MAHVMWVRLAIGVAAMVWTCGCSPSPPLPASGGGASSGSAIELQQFEFGGDFALGDLPRRFALAEHRGEVVLLFFGYTYCPDICPTTLGTIARAQDLLGADRARSFAAFVSVDPGRDTPARLAEYTAHFGVRGIGVTGSKTEIDALVQQYNAYYEIQASASAMGYTVDHTSRIFLIDGAGKVRYLFRSTDRAEDIAAGVRALLHPPVS